MLPANICIAGKNSIAIEVLEYALAHYSGCRFFALCNRNDTGLDGWQRSYAARARALQVPLIEMDQAQQLPDCVFISLEYDRLLKPGRFVSARLYNIHFSLLPAYKGMYTSAWPILRGEAESGVTLHEIDAGIDTGPIVAQRAFPIDPDMTCAQLYMAYLRHGTALVCEQLDDILHRRANSRPQPALGASYYSRSSIDYQQLQLDLHKTAIEIKRQILAFAHRRYQLPRLHGEAVVGASVVEDVRSGLRPGELVRRTDDSLVIATIDYDLEVYIDRLSIVLQACESGQADIVRRLLPNLGYIDEKNDRGWSALIVAAYHGQVEVMRLLLEAGADPNDSNFNGTTVLMYAKDAALRHGDNAPMQLLLAAGADLARRDYRGRALIDYLDEQQARQLGI